MLFAPTAGFEGVFPNRLLAVEVPIVEPAGLENMFPKPVEVPEVEAEGLKLNPFEAEAAVELAGLSSVLDSGAASDALLGVNDGAGVPNKVLLVWAGEAETKLTDPTGLLVADAKLKGCDGELEAAFGSLVFGKEKAGIGAGLLLSGWSEPLAGAGFGVD